MARAFALFSGHAMLHKCRWPHRLLPSPKGDQMNPECELDESPRVRGGYLTPERVIHYQNLTR